MKREDVIAALVAIVKLDVPWKVAMRPTKKDPHRAEYTICVDSEEVRAAFNAVAKEKANAS